MICIVMGLCSEPTPAPFMEDVNGFLLQTAPLYASIVLLIIGVLFIVAGKEKGQ